MMSFDVSLNTPYMIKADDGVANGDIYPYWPQNTERIEIYGSDGLMYVGRMGSGWQVYVRQKSRQPVIRDQMHGRFPDKEHQQNFIECVRSRNRPNADIGEGHLSMLLVHYAMISYAWGRETRDRPEDRADSRQRRAMELFTREYRKPWVVEDNVATRESVKPG